MIMYMPDVDHDYGYYRIYMYGLIVSIVPVFCYNHTTIVAHNDVMYYSMEQSILSYHKFMNIMVNKYEYELRLVVNVEQDPVHICLNNMQEHKYENDAVDRLFNMLKVKGLN